MAVQPPTPPPVGPQGPWSDDSGYDPWAYGSWGYQPWMEPPPPPPRRAIGRGIVAVVVMACLVVGAAAGVVVLVTRQGPFGPLSDSGAVSGQVAQVEQAVVDVDSRLAGGQGIAAGTGMVITSGGEVLTNNHVIEGAQTSEVQVDGSGPTYPASVIGYDAVNDVALLQMQGASGLPTVGVGDSSSLNVGDSVTAIGNALGQGGPPAVTQGSVTAVGQTITVAGDQGQTETLSDLIEMNAPIQQGDSGGPLLDSSGKVVGMDTAAEVGSGRRQSTSSSGYAIPVNDAMAIVRQIQRGGGGSSTVQTGSPPILGVDVSPTSGSSSGVAVSGVEPGTPAERAGIVAGDVITAIDGTDVSSPDGLRTAVRSHHVGDSVTVSWTDTGGQSHSATVRLIAGPPD